MDDSISPTRQVDEALLGHLQRIVTDLNGVARTSLFPANRQESLVIEFESASYPAPIETVRLEVRAYTNGDFHVTYLENYLGDRRQCRWDRHDQDHNSRDHFHPLPKASTASATDKNFPVDLTVVLRQHVFPWVDERLGILWRESST